VRVDDDARDVFAVREPVERLVDEPAHAFAQVVAADVGGDVVGERLEDAERRGWRVDRTAAAMRP
jgi:hypothetical protein